LNDEADDPLTDLIVPQVATQLGRSPGTVRAWIRSRKLEAYWLGKEYRITRSALATFRDRRQQGPRRREMSAPNPARSTPDLRAWRKLRERA